MMLSQIGSKDPGTPGTFQQRRVLDGRPWHNLEPDLPITVADSCKAGMDRLTAAELYSLADYASYRLAKVGLNPSDGEDILQDALLAVLRGLESSTVGRHPRPSDLADQCAFMDYLRGVIGSLVEAERRGRKHRYIYEVFDESSRSGGPSPFPSTCDPRTDFEFSDLKAHFFRWLRDQAPHRLQVLVSAWQEQGEDCEAIPLLGFHRRWRSELRQIAAKVLRKLSTTPCRINKERN